MTRRRVPDEQYGLLTRRAAELMRRVDEGSVPFDFAMEGLQQLIERSVFTFEVNFDDPRWRAFPFQGTYSYVNPDLRLEHFLENRTGRAKVTVKLITFDQDISYEVYLKECQKRGLIIPDRAITETFLDKFDEELKERWIISPCGSFVGVGDDPRVAHIEARMGQRELRFNWDGLKWNPSYFCFLAVREINSLA